VRVSVRVSVRVCARDARVSVCKLTLIQFHLNSTSNSGTHFQNLQERREMGCACECQTDRKQRRNGNSKKLFRKI